MGGESLDLLARLGRKNGAGSSLCTTRKGVDHHKHIRRTYATEDDVALSTLSPFHPGEPQITSFFSACSQVATGVRVT